MRVDQHYCTRCGTELNAADGHEGQGPGPIRGSDVSTPARNTHSVSLVKTGLGGQPMSRGVTLRKINGPGSPAQPAPGSPPALTGLPPAPSPPREGEPRTRGRWWFVLAATLAALVGVAAIVAVLRFNDDPSPSDSREGTGTTTSEPQASAQATDRASPVDSATPTAQTFTCWNGGASVTQLDSCQPPSGNDGMAWVFPSSTGTGCFFKPRPNRASEAECTPTVGGDPLRFHYSEWRARTDLERYYGGLSPSPIRPPDSRDDLIAVHVTSRNVSVGFKVAIYYRSPSALWSVTIYAVDEAQYSAALNHLEVIPRRQLRGIRR